MFKKLNLSFFKDDKKRKILIVALIALFILLTFSFFFDSKPKSTNKNQDKIDIAAFNEELQNKLSEFLSMIDGVGENKVLLTLNTIESFEYIKEKKESFDYSNDDTSNNQKSTYEENFIFVEDEQGKNQALIKSQLGPQIKGVVIACQGGDNPLIEAKIVEAMISAFGIKAHQISVCKLKNQ